LNFKQLNSSETPGTPTALCAAADAL
jgi:hypothetical protein